MTRKKTVIFECQIWFESKMWDNYPRIQGSWKGCRRIIGFWVDFRWLFFNVFFGIY